MTRYVPFGLAALAVPALLSAQTVDQRRSDAANEPTGIGAPAAKDAEALRRAETGWWHAARKTRDNRLAWWRDARFGAFVHWGPYSVLGGAWAGQPNPGYSEHIMRVARIPRATYRDQVAAKFHPDAFDAKAWVALMKAAGMRYVIITAKHHDGFALWPSAASDYNIAKVGGFKRDPLGELVTAARAAGLHVGFYYSHAFDWEDPDAPGNDWDYDNPGGDRKLHGGTDWWNSDPGFLVNTQRYIDRKVVPQLRELVTRYHPDILWFDTPGKLPFFQQAEIVEAVRAADPSVVINGRAARSATANLGDYQNTADRPAELRPTEGDWEAIPTTNESYGYNALDHSHKQPSYFVRLIAKAAAKGGNILLNVGPRGDGTIDTPDVAILRGVADWMAIYGDSVHGTTRTPLDRQSWGDSTVKGNALFLHVFDWPTGRPFVIGGLTTKVRRVYLMGDPAKRPIAFNATGGDVTLDLPTAAPNAIDSVVVVETEGPPQGRKGRLVETRWGTTQLLGFDADAKGAALSYGDGKTARFYVDGLERPGSSLSWRLRATQAARVTVTLRYSTPETVGGGAIRVSYAGRILTAPVVATASATAMRSVVLGTINVKPGPLSPLTLTVDGASGSKPHIFDLTLTPAP